MADRRSSDPADEMATTPMTPDSAPSADATPSPAPTRRASAPAEPEEPGWVNNPEAFPLKEPPPPPDYLPAWATGASASPAPVPVVGTVTEHYRIGRWAGYPNWMCNYCDYATTQGVDAIEEHYQTRHAPPPPPAGPLILGPDGQPLATTGG